MGDADPQRLPAGCLGPLRLQRRVRLQGTPARGGGPAAIDAALKKAKVPLTADQVLAKRTALTTLVEAIITPTAAK